MQIWQTRFIPAHPTLLFSVHILAYLHLNSGSVLGGRSNAVKDQGCQVSIDRRGAWRDNIFVEKLWKTVIYERVYLHAYDTVNKARRLITQYLDWYNRSRLYSRLGKRTPDEAHNIMLPAVEKAA